MPISMAILQADAVRSAAGRFLDALEIPYTAGELLAAKTEPYRGAIVVKMRSGSVEVGAKSGRVYRYNRSGAPALGRFASSKFVTDEEAKAYVRKLALRAEMPGSWKLERFAHRSGTVVGSQNAEVQSTFRPANEGPYPAGEGNRLELELDATTGNVTAFRRVTNIRPVSTGWVTTELDALDQALHLMDRFDEARHAQTGAPERMMVPWFDETTNLYDEPIDAIPAWRVPVRFVSGRVESFDFDAKVGGCFRQFLKPTPIPTYLTKDSRPQLSESDSQQIAETFAKKAGLQFETIDRVLKGKSTIGYQSGESLIEVGRFSGKVRRFLRLRAVAESDRPQKFVTGLKDSARRLAEVLVVPKDWALTERQVADTNSRAPIGVYVWGAPGFEGAVGIRNGVEIKLDGRDGSVLEIRNIDNVAGPLEAKKFSAREATDKMFAAFQASKKSVKWSDPDALAYYRGWFAKNVGDPKECWMVPRHQIARLGIDRPLQATRYWKAGIYLLNDQTGIVTVFDPWSDLP